MMKSLNLKYLNSSKSKISSILKTQSRSIQGYFFTRQPNTSTIKKENSVMVYEGPEWNEINEYLKSKNFYDIIPKDFKSTEDVYNIWQDCVMNTNFKEKYFALLPFFMEDRQTSRAKKKFVLNMELFPESQQLKFTIAMISGLHTFYEPLADVIPIHPGDFRIRHLILRSRPASFIDMDMVYGNRKIINMYCFDKQGTWDKEGVDHPVLKLENSYKEQNWFDHVQWNNQWL